jgi:voltage-gated potassium channel
LEFVHDGAVKIANSFKALFITIAIVIFGAGVGYSLMEPGKTVVDGVWWAIVTVCTVGYGDQYPNSTGGRLLASFLMLSMILFIAPAFIAQLLTKVLENRDAWTHEEQERMKQELSTLITQLGEAIRMMQLVYSEVDDVEELAGAGNSHMQQVQAQLAVLGVAVSNTQLASLETLGRAGATFQFTADGQLHILDAQFVEGQPAPPQQLDQPDRRRRRGRR